MAITAFKNGVSVLDENTLNAIISAQPSVLIFDGDRFNYNEGGGAYENDLSAASYAMKLVNNYNTYGRIELDIRKYGAGADLILEIRNEAFNPNGSSEGTVLKSINFPAKIFSSGYISLPIDLSNINTSVNYWLILRRNGDSNNHLAWIGETTLNSSHPCYYRTGTTGAWTGTGKTPHFRLFANTPGTYTLKHGIYGVNGKTLVEYNADGTIAYIWRWLPASDGTWKIVEQLAPTYDSNGVAIKWEVN